jgi:hypothetical protein
VLNTKANDDQTKAKAAVRGGARTVKHCFDEYMLTLQVQRHHHISCSLLVAAGDVSGEGKTHLLDQTS